MPLETRIRALKYALGATAATALAMFASLFTGLRELMSLFLDFTHIPLDQGQSLNSDAEHLLTAISAGLLFGLCVALWQIATEIYSQDPALGRRMILTSTLSWFVIDTAGSLIVGAWMNGILNTIFLMALMAPVLKPVSAPRVEAT